MSDLTTLEPDAPGQPVEATSDTPTRGPLAWVGRRTIPQALLAAAVLFYTAYFTQRSLDIHHGLGTASYDSALYDQGMWLLSRFEAPFVTLMGRNLFGDHTSFVLLFLVPLYWIAPGAWIMFFSQSAAIAAGAVPIFLYGRKRLESEWYALVGAATYLLHPAVGWTNLENFHPDAFLGVFVGFAIYGALERKWKLYAVFVVLSLLVKEDVSLVVVPLGVWVALRRDRRIGVLTILGSLWFMFTAMFVVMRGLIGVPTRNGWRIPFGGPSGVIDTALTNPTELVDHLRAENRPWYIWQMTAPFAWLFLRLPSVALISAVVLSTNILSTFWYQFQVEYHYGLVAVPALAMGTVYALGAVRGRYDLRRVGRPRSDREVDGLAVGVGGAAAGLAGAGADRAGVEAGGAGGDDLEGADGAGWPSGGAGRELWAPVRGMAIVVLAVTTLVTASLWSPMPFGRTPLYYGQPDNVYATTMRELIAEIPDDASVAAHYRVTPHVAYRTEIYQFPTPFRVELYGADASLAGTRLDERAEGVDFVLLPTSKDEGVHVDWAVISSAFREAASNEYWVLYERDRAVPLPPSP